MEILHIEDLGVTESVVTNAVVLVLEYIPGVCLAQFSLNNVQFPPVDVLLSKVCDRHDYVIYNGAVDSLRTVLFNEHFIKPWSDEYMLVKLLTRSF